ncbi:FHA domain-containing protein [Erwinia sp. V71]|uniref:FHA domain-containing protein n=1 Tax=Erwinia sp. V71 TaxID=3369424 RepID=UPI003F603C0A
MMFELRVLSGLHLGAALPLFGDSWLIGQAQDADLLLSDAGVAEQHCRLHREGEHWRLENLPQGDSVPVTAGEAFAVGEAWLCVMAAEAAWSAFTPPAAVTTDTPPAEQQAAPAQPATPAVRKGGFPRWISALSFSLLLLLTFTVVSWILQPTVAQTGVSSSGRQHLDNASEIRTPLLTMLRERDLASVVSVVAEEKKVVLKGQLNKEQMQVFSRMLSRFNSDYMTALPLDNQVRALKLELPFRIVQITTGKRANIVTEEGQRLFIGDQIDDLRLVAITDNRIEFSGRDNIKVSW